VKSLSKLSTQASPATLGFVGGGILIKLSSITKLTIPSSKLAIPS